MPLSLHLKTNFSSPFHHRGNHKIQLSEPTYLYITNTLRVIAISLVGIFLPIYIYTLSPDYLYFHPNEVINGISWVLSYFLLRSVFTLLTITFLGNAIFQKFHFQLSMILSYVFLIIEILLWHLAQYNLFFMLLAGALSGLKVAFYWIPYHIFFLRKNDSEKVKYGKKTSLRFFLTRIFSGFAPAIGGLVIYNYGFNTLFMISIIILIISAIPIAMVIHDWEHSKHSVHNVLKKYVFNKKYIRRTLGYVGEGTDFIIYSTFWPLLLYFVLDNFTKIGFINTISFLLSSIAVLIIGKFIDKHGTKKIHSFGVVINAILYIPRMLFSSPPLFYTLDVLDRLFSGTVGIPIMSGVYSSARKHGGSDYIMYRELALHSGIVFVAGLILVTVKAVVSWKWVFIPAMMGSMLTMLLEFDND